MREPDPYSGSLGTYCSAREEETVRTHDYYGPPVPIESGHGDGDVRADDDSGRGMDHEEVPWC